MVDIPVYESTAETLVTATSAGQGIFSFDFLVFSSDQVKVEYRPVTGADRELVLNTDYTVSGLNLPNGGSINLAGITVAVGDQLYIWRDTPIEREKDWQNEGDYKADLVNREQDEIYMIMQELRRGGGKNEQRIEDLEEGLAQEIIDRTEADAALAALIGQPGTEKSQFFETRFAVTFAHIPNVYNVIRTGGYSSVGDGGGALYKRVASEPFHTGKVQSADGAWWEIVGNNLSVKVFGAKGDDTSNDYIAIQNAINYMNSIGGGMVYFPQGRYRTGSTIIPKSKVKLYGSKGSVTILPLPTADIFIIYNRLELGVYVEDFQMQGIIFDGDADNTTNTSPRSCVDLSRSRRTRAVDCEFRNATGYGLGYQSMPNWPFPYNADSIDIYLENCRFIGNGRGANGSETYDGIDIKSCERLVMIGCYAEGNYDKGFDVRGKHVTLIGNTAHNNAAYGFGIGANGTYTPDGTESQQPAQHLIMGNHSHGNGADGFVFYEGGPQRPHISVIGNNSHNNAQRGMYMNDSADDVITRMIVQGNLIWNNSNGGFECQKAEALIITGNIITSNDDFGIRLRGNNNTVSNNEIAGHAGPGLHIVNSSSSRVIATGNKIRSNGTGIQTAGNDGIYANNWLEGNAVPLADTGVRNKYRGNQGLVSSARVLSDSFALDSTGVKNVTINHGLAFTPNVEDCVLNIVNQSSVQDWVAAWVNVRDVSATTVTAQVRISTASSTAGATAKLSLYVATKQ